MQANHDGKAKHDGHAKHYGRLALMAGLHFAAMYVLMYAMVNVIGDASPNLNQAYMAGLMTAPMLIFEPLLMGAMYPRRILNGAVLAVGAALLIGGFLLIRQQTAIGDAQFLRSMIPHHSGAILMCEEASVKDADIRRLCQGIVGSQQAEIDWMRAKLASLEGEGLPPSSLPDAR